MITQTKTNDNGIRQLTDGELDAVNGAGIGVGTVASTVPGIMLMGLPFLAVGAASMLGCAANGLYW